MQSQIRKLHDKYHAELAKIKNLKELEALRVQYLSKKNGEITNLITQIPKLSIKAKKSIVPQLIALKKEVEETLANKKTELNSKKSQAYRDLTIPLPKAHSGHLHPTTQIIREMNGFFRYHGFSIGEGPEIEEVEYNFRRLNLPEGHPATDLQDSLYIHEPDILLRTQTSSIETRILSNNQPPLRIVAPGKCYRNETNSSTNASFFYQYQGFVVDKEVNIQHLKYMITKWFQFLWGEDVKIRFRYKYYPEVSPGLGQDIQCTFCKGKGCQICKYRGWIEMGGSGMIHYNTLKTCGINPEIYTGFAFGVGLDRMVMTKFGITDIRKLYGGQIVYK